MTSNLRDRRRQQTAREIQLAALRLSIRSGYAAVTAVPASRRRGEGIESARTFYSCYCQQAGRGPGHAAAAGTLHGRLDRDVQGR